MKKIKAANLVIIGASTGGPSALKELLSEIKINFPFAIIIVQHMTGKSTEILASQLDKAFEFKVKEAINEEEITAGTVFIAPGDRHLLIKSNGTFQISSAGEINGYRPCIDVTMQSAAQAFGCCVTGVILSGMGNDGTEGLTSIINSCGDTFAQSIETCVVSSMPNSAIKKNIVQKIGSPKEIGKWLIEPKVKKYLITGKLKK